MADVTETRSGTWSPGLTPDERATLMRIAWDALRGQTGGRAAPFDWARHALTPALHAPWAAFVTLYRGGRLRGCIGTLEAAGLPLYRAVQESARKAASVDPRFPPLEAAELDGLRVKVSILSAARAVDGLGAFRVGAHGIIMTYGGRQAVFLPEVAQEQGWTAEETAAHLCRKIGLGPEAWRAGAEFSVFESVLLAVRDGA